ncbi:histidine--tRNA ligase [Jannaschia aquimarina]|uniref:Histidine--tRNA ligase n=1 Tax=Jannaschia aquimarina TaxID=935700 RepID=A0A0D1EBG5_9RHOB|nr:histidine--tRNA ligase [Jannaschia aquimarina]KIT15084.1 Histidine--tRNA ligase [Jannaschia aquimarina]SNS63637.1 histidyl-tRNA synthetase [Jannaschia aquimarina]
MAKKDKIRRPRAETPKGFRDYFGGDVTRRAEMLAKVAEVYHRYGFEALETSAVETVEALGKFLPDVDRPNEGVFAWKEGAQEGGEQDGDWMALRYDLTAPLARVYAQHRNDLPTPYRRYAMGPVWRNEKPGPGRFRQFYQCDADTVGAASVAADAEMAMLLADVLEAVGIARGDYVVRVNNRKVLNGVMEAAGIAEDDERTRGIVLRAVDKLDRLGEAGVHALLGEGRKDESGDFTEGARLDIDAVRTIEKFVHGTRIIQDQLEDVANQSRADPLPTSDVNNVEAVRYLRDLVSGSEIGLEGVAELEQIAALLEAQGYGPDRIVIDPSTVRGLGYYTGPVLEAELTFEITDEKGRPRQFGSVAGGGRYDDLVKRFTGQAVPATGVSLGVDRLLAALEMQSVAPAAPGPVVVTVMDRDRMGEYQSICARLRAEGIRAEVYLGNPKNFGNQLKYADKRGSPAAIIQGSDEAARGVVQVKDLILGARLAEGASLEEWKSHEAQTEVPLDGLVDYVKALLAR